MLNNSGSTFEKSLENKEVIVDTSSLLLAGVQLLGVLPSCKLIIPSIVIKELEDNRSNVSVGFLAREWLRLIESLRIKHGKQLATRVPVPGYPELFLGIEPNHSTQKNLPQHLQDGSNDSTILAVVQNLKKEIDSDKIVLLSNDAPMRLHATLDLDISAVEFNSSQILSVEPFSGRHCVEIPEEEYVKTDSVSGEFGGTPFESVISKHLPKDIEPHAMITPGIAGDNRGLDHYIYQEGGLRKLEYKKNCYGITARTIEQSAALTYLQASPEDIPIVSLGGSAGTGKTLLSVAAGLNALSKKQYQKIVVFRSLHEMGQGQEIGFLPGTLEEKMEVWAGAIYDSLEFIASKQGGSTEQNIKELQKLIEVNPITFLRGRSLSNCYIILEEAQNFSRNELLHILSRTGEGTKMVLTFDPNQVDNRFLQSGKNADIWSVIDSLRSESILAHITLQQTERSRVAAVTSRLLER